MDLSWDLTSWFISTYIPLILDFINIILLFTTTHKLSLISVQLSCGISWDHSINKIQMNAHHFTKFLRTLLRNSFILFSIQQYSILDFCGFNPHFSLNVSNWCGNAIITYLETLIAAVCSPSISHNFTFFILFHIAQKIFNH